ncbi:MAG: hypothetical protein R2853_20980 [Thermomicrobiales bacterium]
MHTYVASSNPAADLPWPNSTLLSGDGPAAVAALRRNPAGTWSSWAADN